MNTAKSNTFIPRTNPHAVCGRPTLKDVERSVCNGSVRELCQRSIYERTTMSELIENHCISIELSTDCKFSDGLFVDCKCPETEVARNRNDYQLKRLVGSEEDTILTTDAIFISSQNGFEDQTKKTTTKSVIINWVSLVILFFAIVAFVLLLTGTILFFNSLIMSLTALTLIACLVKHFISLLRRCCIPVCRDYFILQLFYSYHCNHYIGISFQVFHIVSENKCMYGNG